MAPTLPTFGKPSNQRVGSGGGELYLKYFKEPSTRITALLDDPDTWVETREHFDLGLKMSYPCATHEGAEGCVGCNYPVEHPEYEDLDTYFPGKTLTEQRQAREKVDPGWRVRNASPKWIFPALDPKGYVSLFKIGFNLWTDLKEQFKVLGSLTDHEIVISKSGDSFNTIKYTPTAVPGEVRKPKDGIAIPTRETISEVLGNHYLRALEKYGVDHEGAMPTTPDPAPVSPPADEAQQPAQPQLPNTGPPQVPVDSPSHGFVPAQASVGELKDFLDGLTPPVEYPAKAGRPVLVGLCEAAITERGILPY